MRRFLGLGAVTAIALLIGFAVLTVAEVVLVPAGALNGSHAHLPALAATLLIGFMARGGRPCRASLPPAAH